MSKDLPALRSPVLIAAGIGLVFGLACGAEAPPAPPGGEAGAVASSQAPPAGPRTERFDSGVFHVNQKWKSMEGPSETKVIGLTKPEQPEVLWLTGYRASIVGDEPGTEASQEFMCHNNLYTDTKAKMEHLKIFGWSDVRARGPHHRLFTLSQGQFEVLLPEGFGVPVRSDEKILLGTQVLNHNVPNADVNVRHRTEIDFVRDDDLAGPMVPLYPSPVFVMVSLEDTEAYFGATSDDVQHDGSSCSVGMLPDGIDAQTTKASTLIDPLGQRFATHWVVKPGREVRHTLVTEQLALTFDTRIHLIGAHLHPFVESMELRDLTTGESLYTVHPTAPEQGIGIAHVEMYSSQEGIPLYQDHEYEVVSVYDNTSGIDQDAMATFFLYLYDADGDKAIKYMRKVKEWAAEAG
jgi:hypothetical protein